MRLAESRSHPNKERPPTVRRGPFYRVYVIGSIWAVGVDADCLVAGSPKRSRRYEEREANPGHGEQEQPDPRAGATASRGTRFGHAAPNGEVPGDGLGRFGDGLAAAANVTVLSSLVEAAFGMVPVPASRAAPCGMEALTVPLAVIPLTAT